jgi:hypothetical protein
VKVYRGTKGPQKTPCRWIEARITHEWEIHDLVDGLCSKYHRDWIEEDGPLPERLSLAKIMDVVKDEYRRHGTNNVWTWSDNGEYEENEKARAWATTLVLAVLPDIEVPKETT